VSIPIDSANNALPEDDSSIIVSAGDLLATRPAELLAGFNQCCGFHMTNELRRLAEEAKARGEMPAYRGFVLFQRLSSLHMRPADAAQTWHPRSQGIDGRSYMPSDFRGDQNTVLASIVPSIVHPALRAQIADVVWYNDRKQQEAASLAISAYCEIISLRLSGAYSSRSNTNNPGLMDLADYLHRVLQINALTQKRGHFPALLSKVFNLLYERVLETGQHVVWTKIADVATSYRLAEWSRITTDAEKLIREAGHEDYPEAIKLICEIAVRGFDALKEPERKKICQAALTDQTLKMREQVQGASAKAYWTRKSIGELRAAGGFRDRVKELLRELRELQVEALDEHGQFSVPLDLEDERSGTIEFFKGLTLPDILREFAVYTLPPSKTELHRQANEDNHSFIFSSFFSASYVDREGKTYAETPSASASDEASDEWVKSKSLRILDHWRHRVVGGVIEPARHNVMNRFPLEERHFFPIVTQSPFVPPGHEHLFSLGFARFWQGDYASAAHLLIPQLENSLRLVLQNASKDSSKMAPDLLQEDRSLSGLLTSFRTDLELIFGENAVNEIDLLFNYKPGPSLRHNLAHGKLSAGDCYGVAAVYACWFIYHLTCLPLLDVWVKDVAPMIEAQAL
jgi:hypothetical protein